VGAKVIATAGSPAKLDVCSDYGGADYVVDYTTPGWQKEIMKITKGKGVGEKLFRVPTALISSDIEPHLWG
jgi:NADPH2:quinone reductase